MVVERWCRVRLIGPAGEQLASISLAGCGAPDLDVLDDVARLGLLARRMGGRILLADVVPALARLVELAGGLGIEVEGQAEVAEQPLGLEQREEEAHLHDPST